MPRPTCQLNLTLTVEQTEKVEKIAFATRRRPSGAGRDLMLERLELVDAGWALDDEEALEAVKKFLVKRGAKKGKK
ncbi:MAG: hypothetical protein KC964_23010 [Candidatus Omnitrophica bacterium]|nr:hypothetical protein [Candidatus Omnitrophota bacterium]